MNKSTINKSMNQSMNQSVNKSANQSINHLADLERIAFTMSVVCIIVSVISLVSGAYGLITSNRGFILTASSAACASGRSPSRSCPFVIYMGVICAYD